MTDHEHEHDLGLRHDLPRLVATTPLLGRRREAVYATGGYERSVRNLAQTSLDTDMVFRDGYATQLATVTGEVTTGPAASLTIGMDV